MTLIFSLMVLALFGVSALMIVLSLRLLRSTTPGDTTSNAARFFLVALRLAIGWHCFIEGMEKLYSPIWTSETYLRESIGPFSGVFRWVAGDRLIERVDTGEGDTFPAQLDREWRAYANAFARYYELDGEAQQRVTGIVDQREKDTLTTFISRKQTVTKIAEHPPDLKLEMTMKERVAEHNRLLERVRDLEAQFPTGDKKTLDDWKSAKAALAKWRAEMQKTVNDETAKMKTALPDVLSASQKEKGPMPVEPVRLPITQWRLLEWSDLIVTFALIVLGACLMLGFLSRITCLTTALLIFSFYLAMPALPGWPESPRSEGHYLLINKTLIEVIALLALAFLPTGKWAGLDGLLGLCCCKEKESKPAPASNDK